MLEVKSLDDIMIDKDWYYHGTYIKYIYSILENKEILCKFRYLNRFDCKIPSDAGSNGNFHICVTKDTDKKVLLVIMLKMEYHLF